MIKAISAECGRSLHCMAVRRDPGSTAGHIWLKRNVRPDTGALDAPLVRSRGRSERPVSGEVVVR